MREIKFRGWTGEKMHYGWGYFTDESKKSFIVIDENDYHFEPVTLMQFTGLLDKNGKDIYEGDIIRARNLGFKGNKLTKTTKRIVVWGDSQGSWMIVNGATYNSFDENKISGHDIEVIGTIFYENPELIHEARSRSSCP